MKGGWRHTRLVMGNNAKKKVRSLPPLGKESKSRGRRRNEAPAGLDVQVPDRQRLIGSPAPQSFRNKLQERQQRFKKVRREVRKERWDLRLDFPVRLLLWFPHHHSLCLWGRLWRGGGWRFRPERLGDPGWPGERNNHQSIFLNKTFHHQNRKCPVRLLIKVYLRYDIQLESLSS